MKLDRGFISLYFVTKSQKVELEKPYILLSEKKIALLQDILPSVSGLSTETTPILTGSTVFTDELDIKLERVTADLLSSTGSITITKEDTIILNGKGYKDSIQARCE